MRRERRDYKKLTMKTIQQAMLEEIYEKADKEAKDPTYPQRDEFGNYFITLQQLEAILKNFEA